jgi:hypothetical protein
MLSTSVESREGFLVQKHSVTVAIKDFLQDLHSNQVVEDCFSCLLINGTELKLIVSHFIVLSLERNSDFQELILHFMEYLLYFDWDFSIVMV